MRITFIAFLPAVVLVAVGAAQAGVGDVQVKTDHPWYPGELSCSTFDRLFKTQAEVYERVTGRKVESDEDKALASWFWRNVNHFHCTEGAEDLWDAGLNKGTDPFTREYWKGLFADGYSLCYATHAQWHGEMAALLGPCRSRSAGVEGHTTFEVYLTGGPYGRGQWVLLDHDISTIVFTADGSRLMGLMEINKDMSSVGKSSRARGWMPGGLHPDDPKAYGKVNWVGCAAGYATVPPMVHLRSGESIRRYLRPGLEDGKTFVYWGINYNAAGIPGPERSRTWVNQPDKMYKSEKGSGYKVGQARYANAVYAYKPDFASGKYKEAVSEESDDHVTFEFYTPYIIAASPPADLPPKEQWGIYKPGCKGGLVLTGKMTCPVEISTDQGKTWQKPGAATDGMDLTDLVKGHRQYWIRFRAAPKTLADSGLTIRTVCQCAPTVIPHLKDGRNVVTFEASGQAVLSAGPNKDQAEAHLVAGKIGSDSVTLELTAPRKAPAVRVYAACRQASGAPPKDCAYNIDCSTDGGKTWKPVVKDWKIIRREPEPGDFWSQSFCHGDAPLDSVTGPVQVRFTNTGGRQFQLAEAHLVYRVENNSPLKVTFAWKEGAQLKTASRTYAPAPGKADASWTIQTAQEPQTAWVEYAAE